MTSHRASGRRRGAGTLRCAGWGRWIIAPLATVTLLAVVVLLPRGAGATEASAAASTDGGLSVDDPTRDAETLYAAADADDQALRFAAALQGYRAALARSSSFQHAPRARARAELLEGHAEGGFVPLARLERVRRDSHASSDPTELANLARDAEGFPPGRVRVEAWYLVAEAYLGRLDRPNDALPLLERVLADPAADPLTARQASRELVRADLERGALDAAAATARNPRADPALIGEVSAQVRHRFAHRASVALLLLFVVVATFGVARGAGRDRVAPSLRRFAPVAVAFVAWTALVGGGLASSYETGNAAPFLWLGAAILPLLVLARAWAVSGSTRPAARAVRGALAATSILAAAFLVLETVNVSYLQDFGL